MPKTIHNKKYLLIIIFILFSTFLLYFKGRTGFENFLLFRHLYYIPIIFSGIFYGLSGGITTALVSIFSFSPIMLYEIEKYGINTISFEYIVTLFIFLILGLGFGLFAQKRKGNQNFYKALYDIEKITNETLDINEILEELNKIFFLNFSSFIKYEYNHYFIISKDEYGKNEETKNVILSKDSLVSNVINNKQSYLINNIFYNEKVILPVKYNKFSSLAICPLINRGNIFGIIAICKNEKISHEEFQLFQTISKNLSLNLHNNKLYSFTILDSLTQIYNRRYFNQKLDLEFRLANNSQPLSLIIFDIDFFKSVNDTFGHQKGDDVLIKIAEIIKTGIKKNCFPCRIGGEEFSVILPNTSKNDAYNIAENIRINCANYIFRFDNITKNITLSSGISTYPEDSNSIDQLISRADQSLYLAKENGRNRVEVYKNS